MPIIYLQVLLLQIKIVFITVLGGLNYTHGGRYTHWPHSGCAPLSESEGANREQLLKNKGVLNWAQ